VKGSAFGHWDMTMKSLKPHRGTIKALAGIVIVVLNLMPLAPAFAQQASDGSSASTAPTDSSAPSVTSDSSLNTDNPDSSTDNSPAIGDTNSSSDQSQTIAPSVTDTQQSAPQLSQSNTGPVDLGSTGYPDPNYNTGRPQFEAPPADGTGANSPDSNSNSSDLPGSSAPPPSGGGAPISPTVSNPNLFGYQSTSPRVDKASGALVDNVSLDIPPGRNGLQPDLSLNYNSQDLNDSSLVGYGWTLSIPYIQRENKLGTDQLYSAGYFESSIDGELATSSVSGTYLPRVDDGGFVNYVYSGNTWTAYYKNGTRYEYGTTTQAQLNNASSTSQVYRWMLEQVVDANGNSIQYTYAKDNNQIYPSQITYTDTATTTGPISITFATSTRPDATITYQPTFEVTTNYRISEIDAKVNGSLVRKYVFSYGVGNNNSRSLLTSVQETGQDVNGNQLTLPATTFQYASTTVGWNSGSTGYSIDQAHVPTQMNGNGLISDVISYSSPFLGCGTGGDWYINESEYFLAPP